MAYYVSSFLKEWGRWARQSNGVPRLKYPGMAAFTRLLGSKVKNPAIPDPVSPRNRRGGLKTLQAGQAHGGSGDPGLPVPRGATSDR